MTECSPSCTLEQKTRIYIF